MTNHPDDSDSDEATEATEAIAEPAAGPAAPPDAPVERGASLRRKLLARLPLLEYHGASVLDAVKLDADADLRSAIELDADAFLGPLEITTRRGRR
jgi:hypothetical protein